MFSMASFTLVMAATLSCVLLILRMPGVVASPTAVVTVIVSWRESTSLTIPVLKETLKNQMVPSDLIYIHLDLEYFKDVLKEAQQLLAEYPDRMQIVKVDSWFNKHELFNLVLPAIKTRYVTFHDNNNLGIPEKWLQQMIDAFETTTPRPVIVAPKINAHDKKSIEKKPADHHAVMKVTLLRKHRASVKGAHYTPVLIWRGEDGTLLNNTKQLEVRTGDAIETHSWMLDLNRLQNRTSLLEERCAFASNHVEVGLRLYKEFGYGSAAVVTGLEYSYMYPNTHMQLCDVPLTIVRWNAWDSLSSIRYLEQKYNVLYHHQHGWDWHNRHAFYSVLFYKNDEVLTEDPMLTMALTVSMYALQHVTHFTVMECSVPDPSKPNQFIVLNETPEMTIRQIYTWISENAAMIRGSASSKSPGYYRVGILQKTFDLDVHSRPSASDAPPVQNNETSLWIRATFTDEASMKSLDSSDFNGFYAQRVAKFNDINSSLFTVGFVWFQGKFTDAVHKELIERSMMVLYSAVLDVYRYLIFFTKQIEETGLDKEMIKLLYGKHSVPSAGTGATLAEGSPNSVINNNSTLSSVEMTLYFRGYPSRGERILVSGVSGNPSQGSGAASEVQLDTIAYEPGAMSGSIDALTPTFKLIRWGCHLNETNAYRNYINRKSLDGTNLFVQPALRELFAKA